MGKLVNVVLEDGSVAAVPEEIASRSTLSRASAGQEAVGAAAKLNEERSSGIGEGVKAGLEGFADTFTGGAYGGIRGGLDPDYARNMSIRAQQRGGSRLVGEAAALLTPLGELGAVGGAARLGEAVTAATGLKAAGRIVEGGVFGFGAHVAETNVTGDPLTIEGALEGAGVAGVLQFGFGLASDKLIGAAGKAKKAQWAADDLTANIETAKAGVGHLNEAPPSWNEFREAHEAAQSARVDAAETAERQQAEYDKYVTPGSKKMDTAIRDIDAARNRVQSDISKTTYGGQIDSAYNEANDAAKQYVNDTKKADALLNSTKRWPSTLSEVDAAINQVRNRYAPSAAEEALYTPKVRGYTGEIVDGKFEQGAAFKTATRKPPMSEGMDAKLKEFSARRSDITKMKDGGYRLDGPGKWVKDPSIAPDPYGALEALHQLRKDFTGLVETEGGVAVDAAAAESAGAKGEFRSVKFPDLPEVPVRPEGFKMPDGDRTSIEGLAATSRALSDASATARKMVREGNYEGAAEVIRGVRSKAEAAGVHDLVLPTIPERPLPGAAVKKVELPDTLRGFARKHAPGVAEIANTLDPTTAELFGKVADDLGVARSATPGETVAAVHAKLNEWTKAIDEVKASAASADAGGEWLNTLKGAAKNAATNALGYGVYGMVGGGIVGAAAAAAARVVGRKATGVIEDSLLNGSLVAAKDGVSSKIRDIVAKWAAPAAGGVQKLAPVASYLGASIFSGEKDPTTDQRKQAFNRMNEMTGAALSAPDAMFLAVQPMAGHKGDIGWKMHQTVVGQLNHMAMVAPKDPGVAVKMGTSDWTPAWHDTLAYAHRIEALVNPLDAIRRSIAGDGHPAATETLWACWPNIMQEAAQELALRAPQMKNLTYERASGLSQLFRTPLSGLQDQRVVVAIQGLYLPKPTEAGGGAPKPSRGTGGAPGRPAAVQSPVAGSSFNSLIQ